MVQEEGEEENEIYHPFFDCEADVSFGFISSFLIQAGKCDVDAEFLDEDVEDFEEENYAVEWEQIDLSYTDEVDVVDFSVSRLF